MKFDLQKFMRETIKLIIAFVFMCMYVLLLIVMNGMFN